MAGACSLGTCLPTPRCLKGKIFGSRRCVKRCIRCPYAPRSINLHHNMAILSIITSARRLLPDRHRNVAKAIYNCLLLCVSSYVYFSSEDLAIKSSTHVPNMASHLHGCSLYGVCVQHHGSARSRYLDDTR